MKRLVPLIGLLMVAASCGSPEQSTETFPPASSGAGSTTLVTSTSAPPATTAPTSDSSTVPSIVVPAAATTTIALPKPPEGWGQFDVDPDVFAGVSLVGGVGIDGRFVLIGCEQPEETLSGFPIWWSEDLVTWHQADGPAAVRCVSQIETSAFGVYASAFGADGILHSDDGVTWDVVPVHSTLGLGEPWELGVAFAIFVAPDDARVTVLFSRAAQGESRIATLMTTTDGERWEEGPIESAAHFDSSDVSAVLEGGRGLIAVGSSPGGEFVPTAAVFTSTDGLAWERVTPTGPSFDDKVMIDVAMLGDTYVAVGGDHFTTGLMTAWTSADGLAWARAPHPDEQTDPSVAHMTAERLTVAEGAIWASGRDFDARRSDGGLPALWRSLDGVTWERVDLNELDHAVPFGVIETPELRIGVWPPPYSLLEVPIQLFGAD